MTLRRRKTGPDPESIRIVGLHRYLPSKSQVEAYIDENREISSDEEDIKDLMESIRGVLSSVYLIEIVVLPPDADIDWCHISQELPGVEVGNQQAPYDERAIDDKPGHWVFFFHFLEFEQPLDSELGLIKLPPITPIPDYLSEIEYVIPD